MADGHQSLPSIGVFTSVGSILMKTLPVVVCFLPGNSPAYEFYMPTFRNTLVVPSA